MRQIKTVLFKSLEIHRQPHTYSVCGQVTGGNSDWHNGKNNGKKVLSKCSLWAHIKMFIVYGY